MTSWNLADLFERVADAVPERTAIVDAHRRLTFADLDAGANRLAHWLAGRGVGPGDRVGLALHNRAEHVEALLAAFKLRALPVNLNYRYTAEELRGVLHDARPTVVLHEAGRGDTVASAGGATIRLEVGAAYDTAVGASDSSRPRVDRSGDDRYVLYTGGTTGTPKGVVWRHEDLVFGALGGLRADREQPLANPDELAAVADRSRSRLLPACPLVHGTAQWMSLATLLTGGAVVLDPSPSLDAARLWGLVADEQVSQLVIVGDAFARPLLDALDATPDAWDLSSLLVIMSGGAALTPTIADGLLGHLPHSAVVNGYGASESGGHGRTVTFAGQAAPTGEGLVGFLPDDTTAVLDDEYRPLAPGSGKVGRVARRGHLPVGYHGDAELSAAVFPVVDGVRWSVSGDLATVADDGRIVLLGRAANTINSGGEKVFAEEVEGVLRSHPAVYDAVVVGMPDPRWGERVAAVVALRDPASVDAAALQSWCRASLAGFKVPRQLLLGGHVDRHPSGKADLGRARERLCATPDPIPGARRSAGSLA